jgi:anti-sigma B factor antagonist
MFSITPTDTGDVLLAGRFDAAQVDRADAVLGQLQSTTRIDFSGLEYISSAGLGCLLKAQKRLAQTGQMLILMRMNKLVRDIFRMARLEVVFRIDDEA